MSFRVGRIYISSVDNSDTKNPVDRVIQRNYINDSLTEVMVVGRSTDQDSNQVSDQDKTPTERLLSALGDEMLSANKFIPPKDFRQLCEIVRHRFKPVCMKSSKKSRIQNCMTVSNVGIAGFPISDGD